MLFVFRDARPSWSDLHGHAVAPMKLAIAIVVRVSLGDSAKNPLDILYYSTLSTAYESCSRLPHPRPTL